jgi:TatD DNase family protein
MVTPEALPLIDAHTHLADPVFAPDFDAVLARARAAGVARIVLVGETLADARRNLELAERYSELRPCAGLHPAVVEREPPGAAEELVRFAREHAERLVGIGEVGLDHWVAEDESVRQRQAEVLARFVALSLELDLPLNVHSRSAGRATIDFLAEKGARRVLLHAFDGRGGAALRALELGYYFSIPPSALRSRQKEKLLRHLSLDRILLETDSPALAAEPGTRNEPANVRLALRAIAAAKGVAEDEVAARTTENALRLFPRLALCAG